MAINSVTASPAVQQAMLSDNVERPGQPDHDGDDKTVAAPAVTQTPTVPAGSTFAVHA
jgi:hypothetical protein